MRYVLNFLLVPLVHGFEFPDIFRLGRQRDEPTCQNPVVYTVIEYPCAIQTFVPSNTLLMLDACNASISVTNAPTYVDTILTSTTTLTSSSTTTIIQTITVPKSPVDSATISGTKPTGSSSDGNGNVVESGTSTSSTQIQLEDGTSVAIVIASQTQALKSSTKTSDAPILDRSSSATPFIPPTPTTPITLPSTTQLVLPDIPASSSEIAPSVVSSTLPIATPNCLPSTSDYPGVNVVPANTTWLLQLYYISNGNPVSTGAYLTRTSSYTYTASDAVHVFFNDGILFALDTTFGIGFYATTSPPVDAQFQLQEYVSNAGLTAKTFSSGPNWPYPLIWENCGFTVDPATYVWNEDVGNIYVVFDGNENQGTNHEPMILGLVAP